MGDPPAAARAAFLRAAHVSRGHACARLPRARIYIHIYIHTYLHNNNAVCVRVHAFIVYAARATQRARAFNYSARATHDGD